MDIQRLPVVFSPRQTFSTVPQTGDIRDATSEYFSVHLTNAHTRIAYSASVLSFQRFLAERGISDLAQVSGYLVSVWLETLKAKHSTPTAKLRLAGLKSYFDWLVVRGVLAANPASSVRAPRYSLRKGKTPVLEGSETRRLLDEVSGDRVIDLRDRALIAMMLFTFGRVGAVLSMHRGDVYTQGRRLWIRLHEKGGKLLDAPCHHQLEAWLTAYIESCHGESEAQTLLFQSIDRRTGNLSGLPFRHSNAYRMVQSRAKRAGIATHICNHSFRATGITAYLTNGGTIEIAARLANHASTRTTQLYDRRDDAMTLSEIERIRFE